MTTTPSKLWHLTVASMLDQQYNVRIHRFAQFVQDTICSGRAYKNHKDALFQRHVTLHCNEIEVVSDPVVEADPIQQGRFQRAKQTLFKAFPSKKINIRLCIIHLLQELNERKLWALGTWVCDMLRETKHWQ